MSQDAVQRLLGRLLTDDLFRLRAARSLATTCQQEGYRLTPEELRLITPEDLIRLDMVALRLDSGIKRYSNS